MENQSRVLLERSGIFLIVMFGQFQSVKVPQLWCLMAKSEVENVFPNSN